MALEKALSQLLVLKGLGGESIEDTARNLGVDIISIYQKCIFQNAERRTDLGLQNILFEQALNIIALGHLNNHFS
jgi:hypothetical protein